MKKKTFRWKKLLALTAAGLLLSSNAVAQFTGPAATGQPSTVAQAQKARINSHVTVIGNIVNHLREDDYTFRDKTGDMRVEIEELSGKAARSVPTRWFGCGRRWTWA